MIFSQHCFLNLERTQKQRLGTLVGPLGLIEAGEVIKRCGDIGMILSQGP